jgi:hypothetical protein
MLHVIKKVKHLEDYKLELHFDNKSIKVVNLANFLKAAKNMFVPLLDIQYFKKVECDGTTICWPNGVDLCPDVLYKMGKNVKPLKPKLGNSKPVIRSRKKSKAKIP